jgi:hypothetical protein
VELSPRQRSAVFVLVVIVLAVLGYYLVVPAVTHSHGSAAPSASGTSGTSGTSATSSAGSAGSAGSSTPPGTPATAPAVAPTATGTASTDGVNIYAWLPFTPQNLASAASVALRFSVDYNTFTYTESPASYIGAMSGLITDELATTLRAAFQAPGVSGLRQSQRQVSTGTAAINSLRAFGPSSMTFIVTAGQRLATTNGTSNGSTQYAVTVTGSGSSWQVSDIELESAGNT